MCAPNQKIKLCTCVDGEYDDLPHYWLLYRFDKEKNLEFIGQPLWDELLTEINDPNVEQTLTARLNEPDAFDKPITFQENDQLEIVFNNLSEENERLQFCFIYQNNQWAIHTYDSTKLYCQYDEAEFGSIEQDIK